MSTEDDYEDYEDMSEEEDEGLDETAAGIGAWGASVILHAAILAILGAIVALSALQDEKVPLQTPPQDLATPPPPEEKVRELKEVEVTVEAEVTDANSPIVTDLELEVTELETEDEVEAENPVKGREEAVAASETGGSGAFMAMGAGGGSAGAFGSRSGGGRKRAVGRYGGNRASESAVEAALRWFARHQSPNGMWDVDGYPINCTVAGAKCEPGTGHTGADGDVACTGYAVLCFLGAGYDHKRPSKWRKTVKAGVDYLVTVCQEGKFPGKNYTQGVAAMALAEAYAMTEDPELKDITQKAIDVILQRQLRTGDGYPNGWNYTAPDPNRVDSSVSGWCIMALKSAKMGGLDVGDGMEGGKNMVEMAWNLVNGSKNLTDHYSDRSGFPYTFTTAGGSMMKGGKVHNKDQGGFTKPDRTAIGLCCGVFLGMGQGDIKMETMANDVIARALTEKTADYQVSTWPPNTYYLYYNTLGLFQVGGTRFKQWNDVCRDFLVNNQEKTEDCFDGSWTVDNGRFHGHETGRLLHTAYCCLSLEVYYRYEPIKGRH